ncbi:MAG: putative sulfate exporter family transporter [Planctomycetota bacterium]
MFASPAALGSIADRLHPFDPPGVNMAEGTDNGEGATRLPAPSRWQELALTEDWWAVWIGGFLLLLCFSLVYIQKPKQESSKESAGTKDSVAAPAGTPTSSDNAKKELKPAKSAAGGVKNPLAPLTLQPGEWVARPIDAFYPKDKPTLYLPLLVTFGLSLAVFSVGSYAMGKPLFPFLFSFAAMFLLAIVGFVLAGQTVLKHYNLEYVLWALLLGLVISNTMGTPRFLKPAMLTEFYIKTGLVLLGAEVAFGQLVALGKPGIFISWVTTPIVFLSTYLFGQYLLGIRSRSLNLVISADMSVCGVSAAIATGAACKATKEEVSLAIGLSLAFTAGMMVAMPPIIDAMGLGPVVGGAWIGGTIDSTGAVAAAGGMLGDVALKTATAVKMIQNILIGVIAFGVAVYWVTFVEKSESASAPSVWQIWDRFPKFVLGFVAASLVFSFVIDPMPNGSAIVKGVDDASKNLHSGTFASRLSVSDWTRISVTWPRT